MIFPVFILVTPLAFGLSLVFDHRSFAGDWNYLSKRVKSKAGMFSK